MLKLAYNFSEKKDKPKADISIITDYDQRYLGIISKIFYKELAGWNDKGTDALNALLARGGHIAAYWHKMRLVGAALWERQGEGWRLLHICFKMKEQRRGHGRVLLDFIVHKITETDETGLLQVDLDKNSPAHVARFFEKYGFEQRGEQDA